MEARNEKKRKTTRERATALEVFIQRDLKREVKSIKNTTSTVSGLAIFGNAANGAFTAVCNHSLDYRNYKQ